MELTTTQTAMTGLSDMLFLQRPETFYGIIVAMVVVGLTFWILGHQLHRIFLTVLLAGIGALAGWKVGGIYGFEGVNIVLAVVSGAMIGAGVGYWLFRLLLGVFASFLISLILLSLYSGKIALPYLNTAAAESNMTLMHNGIELSPGGKATVKKLPLLNQKPSEPQAQNAPMGKAYLEIKNNLLPRLSRAQYPHWGSWARNFWPTVQVVREKMLVIMPRLGVDLFMIGAVALIFGFVLVVLRPVFLDIAYTSLAGISLAIGGIMMFLVLKDIATVQWIWTSPLIFAGLLSVLWLIGIGIQYAMVPPPPVPVEEGAEEEDGSEKEKPQEGKKKK